MKTIFCDLDGTLVKQPIDITLLSSPDYELEVLPGVKDFLHAIDANRHHLIITTGRKISLKEATIKQLQTAGIFYDQLIMGFGGGDRLLINNTRRDSSEDTAYAVTININEGVLGNNMLEEFIQ